MLYVWCSFHDSTSLRKADWCWFLLIYITIMSPVSLQGKLDLNSTLKKAEEHFYDYCKRSSWDYLSGRCRMAKRKEDHFFYHLRNLFSWDLTRPVMNVLGKDLVDWYPGVFWGILNCRMMLLLNQCLYLWTRWKDTWSPNTCCFYVKIYLSDRL